MARPIRVAVIGAGFGGLAAALALAERGAEVVLFERIRYAGGCAATFTHRGRRFEAGATLFAGLGPSGLFTRWLARHGFELPVEFPDPVLEMCTPGWRIAVPASRAALVERFCALPGAPRKEIRAFFEEQERVAGALWQILEDPEAIPATTAELFLQIKRAPSLLPLARWVGRPLSAVLARHGLASFEPMRTYVNAVSQITVQCSADEAEAPFALATLDYFHREAGHVIGGIGVLADAMVQAIRRLGGSVSFTNPVRAIRRRDARWIVEARRGTQEFDGVVADVLPQSIAQMLGSSGAGKRLATLSRDVERGFGAAMLYRSLPAGSAPEGGTHFELIADPAKPFVEGNHIFGSLSAGENGAGERSVTVSTHVDLSALLALEERARGARMAEIQARMRATLDALGPAWVRDPAFEATASPRTFERFTGRWQGFVGGIPRRAGLRAYRGWLPAPMEPGLYMVGDCVFPGQSTLAVALGGIRVARRLLNDLL